MTTKTVWPSEMTKKTAARSSSYRNSGTRIPTDHKSGALVILFVILMIAGVLGGLWFLVLDDMFSQLQTLKDALPQMELASAGRG